MSDTVYTDPIASDTFDVKTFEMIQENLLFTARCKEPSGDVMRHVWVCKLTTENITKLWEKFSQFPLLFGYNLRSRDDFLNYFLDLKGNQIVTKGIFFVIDDFVGVYYMSDIVLSEDAVVHYSFFDRRHHGRVELTKAMIKYVFENYGFQRLTTWIPMNTAQHRDNPKFINAFQFAKSVGFQYEGRKRKCIKFKGEWFDMKLYGILRDEVLVAGHDKPQEEVKNESES